MASDVERIAEVLAKELFDAHVLSGGDATYEEMAQQASKALTQAGIGHVPTALHQAADVLDAAYLTQGPEGRVAVRELRARADRAGGAS